MGTVLDKNAVAAVLKQVQDPELKRDIVSLGMVKQVSLDEGAVSVELESTVPASPVNQKIEKQVREKIGAISGVGKVDVQWSRAAGRGAPGAGKGPIPGIKHVIAVASGKGGVGKSTVAVNLAVALTKQGARVGLMDGDIYGPNIPLMLGVPADRKPRVDDHDRIIPLEAHGIRMISMGVLVPPDQPMVWRGPMLHSAVTQFLQKVAWGELDYLLVDLPPGTGDVQLSLVQTVPLTGAVIVTTPQEVSLMDARKAIAMFQKTQVRILGIIENMAGEIFGSGGGQKAAASYGVPFLGRIPLDGRIREGGDRGQPVTGKQEQTEAARNFMSAAQALTQTLRQTAKPSQDEGAGHDHCDHTV